MTRTSETPIFLDHLARRGAGSIHPLGRHGTEILIHACRFERGERVLELGCGTGETLVRIAGEGIVQLTGLDVSSAMVDCARRRCAFCGVQEQIEIQHILKEMEWPVRDGCLDVVFAESVMAILNAESRRHVLSEVLRVLRPGGRFLFSDSIWRQGTGRETIRKVNESCRKSFGLSQATEDWVGLEPPERELQEAGFEGISTNILRDISTESRVLAEPVSKILRRSRRFTLMMRIRAMLSPSFVAREFAFFRAAYRHREVGHLIEARFLAARRRE